MLQNIKISSLLIFKFTAPIFASMDTKIHGYIEHTAGRHPSTAVGEHLDDTGHKCSLKEAKVLDTRKTRFQEEEQGGPSEYTKGGLN